MDFKGESNNIININISMFLIGRSGNISKGTNWEGIYTYDLIQDNKVGQRIRLSFKTIIFIFIKT